MRDLLQRDFTATRPNEKWVADITYLRTWNGFVYLAFILDCYSRMIVGWQLATHLRTDLVLDALEMANGLRQPGEGLIAHTDRGSQPEHPLHRPARRARCRAVGRLPRRRPRHAMAEAWLATFKSELVDGRRFPATSTPSTRRCTGSASTTRSGCTKNSETCRPPSTRS
ncbi:MAG: DDE-type integrase/transposase/recombinase [Gaiellaceae bacterium]